MKKFKSGKTLFKVILLTMMVTRCYSQKEFFRSQQVFTDKQLANFYSSITLHNDLVLFNANDYHLYAYNKKDGSLQWSYDANYKTSIPVFVKDSIVYAGIYTNQNEQSAQLDLSSGKLIRELSFGPLATKPFMKDGILYGTAIYGYGCLVAYDLDKDTVTWSRFLAHGFSTQPYYQGNKILANAEGTNWVALGYDGVLLDTTCATKANIYVEDIPCVNKFIALSHDGLEIKGKLAEDIFGKDYFDDPDIITAKNCTVILAGDKLNILSGKLKKLRQISLPSLSSELVENSSAKLIQATDENTWLLYGDYLLQYNHKTKKLSRTINLGNWLPQSLVLDGENAWLVSGKDGLLYGLSL